MKKILAFDIGDCTGCRICELICALQKGEGCNPSKARIKVIKSEESGIDAPAICQHCKNPPCQDACPVDAIVRDPQTDAVILREDLCIGCRACTLVCPFGVITTDVDREVMMKCDLCQGNPQCVEFCPTAALQYDRIDVIEMRNMEKKHEEMIEAFSKSL